MTELRLATVIGVPSLPDVHVRSGPGTEFESLFKASKGVTSLTVLETHEDCQRLTLNGHLMQWHRLKFIDGREGWIREDLLHISVSQGAQGTITIVAPPVYIAPEANPARAIAVAGVYVRSAPTTEATKLGVLNHGSEAVVTGVHNDRYDAIDGATGLVFRWYSLAIGGYVREDVVRRVGDWSQFGLSAQPASVQKAQELWPNPSPGSQLWNGFNLDPQHLHRGWDYGATGNPLIYSAPVPGEVVKMALCAKCGRDGISSYPTYPLNDRRVWNDPDWQFGLGHHVIIKYLHQDLPEATKQYLASRSWQGWDAYCVYAHFQSITVTPGQKLGPSHPLGRMGHSGNANGDHLHLELKFGPDFKRGFAGIERGLSDPGVLFSR